MNSNENSTTTTTRLSILKPFKLNVNQEEETHSNNNNNQHHQQQQSNNNHYHHHHHHHHHRNSILTRNLRQNNGQQQINSPQKLSLINNISSLNHQQHLNNGSTTLINKTGFTDLSFIDFSCINFPRIAQNYCELWPRKVSLNTPLHNYTCLKCYHSFPCPASLQLHNENELNCKLLLSNLNKIVYKTIDDIIAQIEYENEFEEKEKEKQEDFLKIFGLVKKEKLTNENKRLKLREKLIDINWQFIKDLDKWKLSSHLNQPPQTQMYKILLKPNVNLNRPLLIRSKKVKRVKSFGSSSIYYYSTKPPKESSTTQVKNNNVEENNKDSTSYRIVRIARSNSTSSSSTAPPPQQTTTTTIDANLKKRKINNGSEIFNNMKRIKKQSIAVSMPTPPTAVDSISFKKILTISNELVMNKSLSKTAPPPLYKVSSSSVHSEQNRKVFEMPKLQPILTSSSSSSSSSNNSKNNLPTISNPPKLKPISTNNHLTNQKPTNNNNNKPIVMVNEQQQKSNENLSLKCRVCASEFKGQTQFFKHFLHSHQEVMRERFNRQHNSQTQNIKVKVN